MGCDVSEEQLWSWIDWDAPALEAHLAACPRCRALADGLRAGIKAVALGSTALSVPLPERIGSYVIKGLLGEGGQGLVYRAEQQTPRRPVALKVLKGGCSVGAYDLRHFQREIQTLGHLSHPGIATIYEAGRSETGQYFFAMELVVGVPLDAYVREHDVPLPQRLELFCRVCDTVQYAHGHGVIHRDLKPSNVQVDAAGSPKILDFGLARLTAGDITLTQTSPGSSHIIGTLRYMSPEQARGNPNEIDARSDIYSLGVILYELLTDKPPYDVGTSLPEAIATIRETPPRRPSTVTRVVRGDLETVVLKALEKEPARRYQSVDELGADVRRHLKGEPILARPPSRLYVVRKKLFKNRLRIALAGVAVILGLVGLWGGAWWTYRAVERARARELAEARTRHAAELAGARYEILRLKRWVEIGRAAEVLDRAWSYHLRYPELAECILLVLHARYKLARQEGNEALREDTLGDMRKRLGGDPTQWGVRALLADLYREIGDPRADQEQGQADRDAPDTPEGWYLRSFATLDIHRAVRYAETAVERDLDHRLARVRLAHLYLLTDDFDQALRVAHTLIELEGGWGWITFQGEVLVNMGRYPEAVERFTQAINAAPDDPEPYRARAVAYLCLADYEKSLADCDTAALLPGPSSKWISYIRATPLWVLGQLEEAAADYRAVRELRGQPSHADIRLFLVLRAYAQRLRQEGRLEEAARSEVEAKEVLAAGLHGTMQHSRLHRIFECLAGEITAAELVAFAAPQNPEEVCEHCYYAGETCLLRGQHEEARKWFRRCVDTRFAVDRDSTTFDPMNEYHLAVWRLNSLFGETADAGGR